MLNYFTGKTVILLLWQHTSSSSLFNNSEAVIGNTFTKSLAPTNNAQCIKRETRKWKLKKIENQRQNSAYRAHHSSNSIAQMMVKKIGNKKMVGTMKLDFSAAFDVIERLLLKTKLIGYGFLSTALSWMESYLSGRQQRLFLTVDSQKQKMYSVESHKAAARAHFYFPFSQWSALCPGTG